MTKDKDPFVSKATGEDFTRVTFKPDLAKFKMDHLDEDIVALMSRRAYDVAGSTKGVKVYLNGKLLPVRAFLFDDSVCLSFHKVLITNQKFDDADFFTTGIE